MPRTHLSALSASTFKVIPTSRNAFSGPPNCPTYHARTLVVNSHLGEVCCRMGRANGSFRQVVGMCESTGRQDERSARSATVSTASDLCQKPRVEFGKTAILETQHSMRNHGLVTSRVRTMILGMTVHMVVRTYQTGIASKMSLRMAWMRSTWCRSEFWVEKGL